MNLGLSDVEFCVGRERVGKELVFELDNIYLLFGNFFIEIYIFLN